MRLKILSLAMLLGAIVPGYGQMKPDDTVKSMTVAEGLQVELFAAEPLLINPTSMDIDPQGRVWITEAVNYRRVNFKRPILREAGDRVVILTDKDGDGKADDSTVFYQGKELYGPLGIAVAPMPNPKAKGACKVFVCQSPDILVFDDLDGDGKADGPPKKFLTGIGGFDHDHGVHGINIGPDGLLYFTIGDSGVTGLQSANKQGRIYKSGAPDCLAGTVWRCDFEGNNLELYAHNFRNNYECCVNSFGEVWLSDNDDDGNQQTRICFVMKGGNYGYYPRGAGQTHWHEEQPGIVHKTLRTGFGSPTGICFYEGTLLPKKYHGQLLHTDAGPRELRAFLKTPKGAGYELEKVNILTSTDNWFRLADVCVAPDGSVLVADWYDPGVGGHGMGDWTRGRVYRVTPKGHQGYKIPEVKLDTNAGILAALSSPCLATRHLGATTLLQKTESEALDVMLEGLKQNNRQLQAYLFLFATRKANEPNKDMKTFNKKIELIKAMDALAVDPEFGAMILRQANTTLRDEVWLKAVAAEMVKAKFDPGAARELMLIGQARPAGTVSKAIADLMKKYDGQDLFYRAALNIMCGLDEKRRDEILADFDKHFPEWNDRVADLVWELQPKSMLAKMGTLLNDSKVTAAQKARIVEIIATSKSDEAGKTMLAIAAGDAPKELKAKALEQLRLHVPTKWKALSGTEELNQTVKKLLEQEATQGMGLQLISATKATGLIDPVLTIAMKSDAPGRSEAIRTLGQLQSPRAVEALVKMLDEVKADEKKVALAQELINALGGQVVGNNASPESKKALDQLSGLFLNLRLPLEARRAALGTLAGSRPGTGWLIAIKERGGFPDDMAKEGGQLLRNSPFQGERNKAMLLFPAPGKLDPKKLPPITELIKRTGNAKRGEAVFQASMKSESQCMRCHMVRGVGGNIGPDLSMIGKKASKENLYDSILTPSKAIADQYVQWKVDALDGKSISGLLVAENETALTLRDANGKDHTFPLKDLDGPKAKSLTSIMPDNLVAAITEDELVDLVEYMVTLKTSSVTPETWNAIGPFANDAKDSGLDADLGIEGKPIDVAKKMKGRDGEVAWQVVKVNGAGYADLTAHHGPKSPNSATYLTRVIESPVDQEATILFGNDDGAKIWLGGEKVFENRDHFSALPGRHQIKVKLKKGPNVVGIKIVNGSDPHGFYFALMAEQELKLAK